VNDMLRHCCTGSLQLNINVGKYQSTLNWQDFRKRLKMWTLVIEHLHYMNQTRD